MGPGVVLPISVDLRSCESTEVSSWKRRAHSTLARSHQATPGNAELIQLCELNAQIITRSEQQRRPGMVHGPCFARDTTTAYPISSSYICLGSYNVRLSLLPSCPIGSIPSHVSTHRSPLAVEIIPLMARARWYFAQFPSRFTSHISEQTARQMHKAINYLLEQGSTFDVVALTRMRLEDVVRPYLVLKLDPTSKTPEVQAVFTQAAWLSEIGLRDRSLNCQDVFESLDVLPWLMSLLRDIMDFPRDSDTCRLFMREPNYRAILSGCCNLSVKFTPRSSPKSYEEAINGGLVFMVEKLRYVDELGCREYGGTTFLCAVYSSNDCACTCRTQWRLAYGLGASDPPPLEWSTSGKSNTPTRGCHHSCLIPV